MTSVVSDNWICIWDSVWEIAENAINRKKVWSDLFDRLFDVPSLKMSILLILLMNGLLDSNNNNYDLRQKFEDFVNKYNKSYKTDSNEYEKRFVIFKVWSLMS